MQRPLPGRLGAFGRSRRKPGLTFPVAQVEVVSEPSAPLPAEIALPPDAGSLALASDGAACCWATSGPAVASVTGQLLWGEIPEWGRVSKGHHPPTEDLSASCIWSGFLYCCSPHPPLSTLLFSNLQRIHLRS